MIPPFFFWALQTEPAIQVQKVKQIVDCLRKVSWNLMTRTTSPLRIRFLKYRLKMLCTLTRKWVLESRARPDWLNWISKFDSKLAVILKGNLQENSSLSVSRFNYSFWILTKRTTTDFKTIVPFFRINCFEIRNIFLVIFAFLSGSQWAVMYCTFHASWKMIFSACHLHGKYNNSMHVWYDSSQKSIGTINFYFSRFSNC